VPRAPGGGLFSPATRHRSTPFAGLEMTRLSSLTICPIAKCDGTAIDVGREAMTMTTPPDVPPNGARPTKRGELPRIRRASPLCSIAFGGEGIKVVLVENAGRQRPRCRAAESRDECPAFH
jgi:hypothetical protein